MTSAGEALGDNITARATNITTRGSSGDCSERGWVWRGVRRVGVTGAENFVRRKLVNALNTLIRVTRIYQGAYAAGASITETLKSGCCMVAD